MLRFDARLLIYQLTHSGSAPQVKVHLELLGAFVNDHELNGVFLRRAEHPAITSGTASEGWPNGVPAACIKQVDGSTYRRVAQPRQLHDLHDVGAFFVQPRDLLAPLVKLPECLVSCAFFLCPPWIQKPENVQTLWGLIDSCPFARHSGRYSQSALQACVSG